jgi:TonB family protein
MAEAIANQAKVKTKPAFKSGPDPVLPESAKAAGVHGKVEIAFIIDVEGKPAEISVVKSSRSPELDGIAVAAVKASLYEPAKDKDGKPIALRVVTPTTFSAVHIPGKTGGILYYDCAQFLRDEQWWAATWPGEKSYIYNMSLGAVVIATRGSMSDSKTLLTTVREFGESWQKAKDGCAKEPEMLFVDALKPGGAILRRLASAR